MKAKCISVGDNLSITKGNIYEVVLIGSIFIKVKNDLGKECVYSMDRFEIVEEEKEMKFKIGDKVSKMNGDKWYVGRRLNYVRVIEYFEKSNSYRLSNGVSDLWNEDLLKLYVREAKETPKTDISYLILDISGSIDQKQRDEYIKIHNKLKETSKEVKVITHTRVAKFNSINFKEESGGTFLSSGLGLAIGDMIVSGYKVQGKVVKVVQATDGDNWSEDNERLFSAVKNLLKNGVDYEYYEINPPTYSTTMHYRFEKEMPQLKENDKLHIIKSEQKKSVIIYEIEHAVGGKRYDFISDECLMIGEMASCDTKFGNSYGKIIDKKVVSLTNKEKGEYKKCKGLVI